MTAPDTWPPVGPKTIEISIIFTVPAAFAAEYSSAFDLGSNMEAVIAESYRTEGLSPVEVKCLNIYDADEQEENEVEQQLRERFRAFLPLREIARKSRRNTEAGAKMVEASALCEALKEEIGHARWRAIFDEEYLTFRRQLAGEQ